MSDMIERKLEQKRKADAEKYMKEAMPSLAQGKLPETKMKEGDITDLGKLVKDQAKAKEAVQKTGNVEMNVGQLRNVGEGPMILRTSEEEPKVDAVTGAAPVIKGKGGVNPTMIGATPVQATPQIVQNGPPPDYLELETPDMRAQESKIPEYKKSLEALEKEEGPGFWDILEAGLSGFAGKESQWSLKQGEKRKEQSAMKMMQQEAAINKATQLEIMAKQAEIEGNRDKALALQREADAQRNQARALELLEKEYGLKKGESGNFIDLIGKFLGGQK